MCMERKRRLISSAFGLASSASRHSVTACKMLFGFGNEKFQDFGGHVAILRQIIDKRVRRRRVGNGFFGRDLLGGGFTSSARGGRRRETQTNIAA